MAARSRRAVAYGRRSQYDPESKAIDLQHQICADWCERNGWELVGWYADDGISGKKDSRPQFRQMLRRIAEPQEQIGALVIPWLSRLCRASGIYYRDIEPLEKAGLQLIALDIPGSDNPAMAKFMLGIMLLISQFYADEHGQRMRTYNRQRAKRGEWPGGWAAFGYRLDDGRLVPDPKTGPLVVQVFQEFVRQAGDPFRTASALNQAGIPAPRGGLWRPLTIRYLVQGAQYRCKIAYEGTEHDGDGTIAPLVPPELLAQAAALVHAAKRAPGRQRRPRPLSGLLVCGHCQVGRVHAVGGSRGGYRHVQWRCARAVLHSPSCSAKGVSERMLESALGELLAERLKRYAADLPGELPGARVDYKARIDRLRSARRELILLRSQHRISDEEFDQAAGDLSDQITELEAASNADRPVIGAAEVREFLELLAGDWHQAPPAARRTLYLATLNPPVLVRTQPELELAVDTWV